MRGLVASEGDGRDESHESEDTMITVGGEGEDDNSYSTHYIFQQK